MKNIKSNPYMDDRIQLQDKSISLSSDVPMHVFEMLKIVLNMGLNIDNDSDTKDEDFD